MLGHVTAALPAHAAAVVVDGNDTATVQLADLLAATLREQGRLCARLTDAALLRDEDTWRAERLPGTVADGHRWRHRPPTGGWDAVVWVRTPPSGDLGNGYRGDDADIVIDLHDPTWPVIRHIDGRLAAHELWYRTESQAFFAARAATWDTKFGDDQPAYAQAVAQARLPAGATTLDLGCGTGRALPALRDAIGPQATLLGVDLTPQMLTAARQRARHCGALLLLADAQRLPLPDASIDAVFAAGLINHLPDLDSGLAELARITRTGGSLILFHPSGRAALAARHGRALRPDEPLAEPVLRAGAARTGWELTSYDDDAHRFHAVAVRR
ncbi:hypothetical protein Ahu01nite_094750 [Winogradskya humida]|uniref:Methyltransferase type 11 domain-containing protein n=1 Tax=Winogradskya humida TaxID=113566 RepID=A0ABQ4A6A4_9ACTN|nr:hypothetical protein Ahu01nite_094750 [Actinoplanes humidus]